MGLDVDSGRPLGEDQFDDTVDWKSITGDSLAKIIPARGVRVAGFINGSKILIAVNVVWFARRPVGERNRLSACPYKTALGCNII